ncbi:MAG: DUF4328 domain-containing protein [Mycobacteriaceae bacterium]
MQQFCHRCAAALPVLGRPMQWCPRCGGVLSAPTTQRPTTLRWVAEPPRRAPKRVRVRQALGPTPRYASVPRWGLPRTPLPRSTVPSPPSALERMIAHEGTARPLLVGAATVLMLAALAELWRYVLLLRSRSELLPARTVAISDSMVITAGVLAPMVVLVTVVTCTLWLLRVREAAAARIDRREARSTHSIVLAIFVPVWNLLMPGVLLTELERDINTGLEQDTNGAASTGPSRLLRTWWVSWVLSVVLAAGVWLWRLRDTVQARADGVLLAALSDLVAAGAVLLTLLLVQRYSEALAGVSKRTSRRRWVASVPAVATGTI